MFWSKKKVPPPPPPAPAPGAPVVVNPFDANLYRRLSAKSGNLFFSPYSISAALAMVQAGAAGKTREEIETVLGFPGAGDGFIGKYGALQKELAARSEPTPFEKRLAQESEGVQPDSFGCHLSVANALWKQAGYVVRPEFVVKLQRELGSEVREADFATAREDAAAKVNAWAAQATHDKIREVIDAEQIDRRTRVMLANAIYFKARWQEEFQEQITRPGPFTRLDGRRGDVPMMHQRHHFAYARDGALQVLRLPYSGGKIAMEILLPDAGAFAAAERDLDAARLGRLLGEKTSLETQVTLPKFRVESTFELKDDLIALGMPAAFGPQADFSAVSSEPEFALGGVIHKTFVDVNERGTEAAAVTIPMMCGAGVPQQVVEFTVDRPFLFLIRDLPTSTTLFMGRVLDPGVQ
jgi:serpin B